MINGIYEQVINRMISELLEKDNKVIKKMPIDPAEKNLILAEYISGLIRDKFRHLDDTDKVNALNQMIDLLKKIVADEDVNDYLIEGVGELLLEVKDIKPFESKSNLIRPITSIARSSLFTGSKVEPSLFAELKKEILSADRIDILVSFIKYSGLRLLIDEFRVFTRTKKLRLFAI
ncbi:hypothetical protein BHF71_07205 [Vulcanibacillus modesticaldus]|uniref:Uncharacterized protein n=1 Tax=Vulcanibacillus modesticaldus TaxID=337097 RepID=A0A1D2YWG1_9BACI|nr:hypothetical protein [Vulcanibacillus modesticaldus]OEF99975.1 hypothetical protein BHF71_07205 [Vulcanibacillus modesticaldus]